MGVVYFCPCKEDFPGYADQAMGNSGIIKFSSQYGIGLEYSQIQTPLKVQFSISIRNKT